MNPRTAFWLLLIHPFLTVVTLPTPTDIAEWQLLPIAIVMIGFAARERIELAS